MAKHRTVWKKLTDLNACHEWIFIASLRNSECDVAFS